MDETDWTLMRISTVVKKLKLPRPRVVQTVVHKGTKEECEMALEKTKLFLKPMDTSTEDIKVEFKITRNGESKTSLRPGNGKR